MDYAKRFIVEPALLRPVTITPTSRTSWPTRTSVPKWSCQLSPCNSDENCAQLGNDAEGLGQPFLLEVAVLCGNLRKLEEREPVTLELVSVMLDLNDIKAEPRPQPPCQGARRLEDGLSDFHKTFGPSSRRRTSTFTSRLGAVWLDDELTKGLSTSTASLKADLLQEHQSTLVRLLAAGSNPEEGKVAACLHPSQPDCWHDLVPGWAAKLDELAAENWVARQVPATEQALWDIILGHWSWGESKFPRYLHP